MNAYCPAARDLGESDVRMDRTDQFQAEPSHAHVLLNTFGLLAFMEVWNTKTIHPQTTGPFNRCRTHSV